jgi:hypothetical protein
MRKWHEISHWSDKKYNSIKDSDKESFHRSRRMFVIVEKQLLIADSDIPDTHAEWFEKEGWLSQENDGFMETKVRGFIDSEGIYAYIGYDYRSSRKVEKLLTSYVLLQQFVVKLDAERHTRIYAGMQKQESGGKYQPRKYLGCVIDFLGEYQFKTREDVLFVSHL